MNGLAPSIRRPRLKNNEFFVGQAQGVNTLGFPLFCHFALIYKPATKAPLFLLPSPGIPHLGSFLFSVLLFASSGFFAFLHKLGFVCFGVSHIFLFLNCFFLEDERSVSLLFHAVPCLLRT